MERPLIRVDTEINTDVKGSKVFGLAFVKNVGVTDQFTDAQIRTFVLPNMTANLVGSAIVQLDSVSSGENYHSGRGNESFTGVLTKVFSNGITDTSVTSNVEALSTSDVNVYFLTVDGINETAVRMKGPSPFSYDIYGYRDFVKRFDSTVTFDNVGDKLYTAVTTFELSNPSANLLTMSTDSALVIQASDSYVMTNTERMLLNPIVKPTGYIPYPWNELYPNPTLTAVTNIHATFTNGTLNGYYKTEVSHSSTPNWWLNVWTDNGNHFHTTNNTLTNYIDIDFGTTCLIDRIKYFANKDVAPQECYIFASDTEINGNVTWPSSSTYFTNVDTYGNIDVNGTTPVLMSELLSKTTQQIDSSAPFSGATDVLYSASSIPWLRNSLEQVLVGRYVRMYIQMKHSKRYDKSYTSLTFVGGTLIQCFGKPMTTGSTKTYNLSNTRPYLTQYYDNDLNTKTRFLVSDITVSDANQPLPSQFYNYTWTTNAAKTSVMQYTVFPVKAQLLLNPSISYTQAITYSISHVTNQSYYFTDLESENLFPYRLYSNTTAFTHVAKGTFVWPDDGTTKGESYSFTNNNNGLSGYYKFSNTFYNKWGSALFSHNLASHFHSEDNVNQIIVDIDLGTICDVKKMHYFSSTHLNVVPTCQQMAIYVSRTEIHGKVGWPLVNSEDPYNGSIVNATKPTVLKPIDGAYNTAGVNKPYVLSDDNTLQFYTGRQQYTPLMEHETDFGTGRYIRVYMRRIKSPLQYVGGTLLAFFGNPV